jgi:multiple sugar transport system permease protein
MKAQRGIWAGRILLILGIVVLLVPIYWLVKSAFSDNTQLFLDPPQFFPVPISTIGFEQIFGTIAPDLGVSAVIAIGCVVLTLIVALPTAFGLTLLQGGKGSGISKLVVLLSLMFPSIMFVIPLYSLFYQAHLLNTIPGLIIADSIYAVPLGILVSYTYFMTIPAESIEAARIDGASQFVVFFRIVCPLSLPAITTSAIFAFLFGWGDYLFAVTFGAGRNITPATIAISGLVQGQAGVTPWPQVMAGSVLLCIPALVAILFAQRYITSGLSAGAVK